MIDGTEADFMELDLLDGAAGAAEVVGASFKTLALARSSAPGFGVLAFENISSRLNKPLWVFRFAPE